MASFGRTFVLRNLEVETESGHATRHVVELIRKKRLERRKRRRITEFERKTHQVENGNRPRRL